MRIALCLTGFLLLHGSIAHAAGQNAAEDLSSDAENAEEEIVAPIVYPEARVGDVVDVYHGEEVPDPYRWLEDPKSEETQRWVAEQVELTTEWLADIPKRDELKERLKTLWNYEEFSNPSKKGDRYFFRHNNGQQDHSVLYTAERLDGAATVVLDPNTLSRDGTVSLGLTSLSEDGLLMAYGTSDGGSDWTKLHIRDVLSQRNLTETLEWVKFSGASWTHDNNGFFYSRYPQPENVLESVNEHQKLYYHQIGTPQEHDRLIYESPENPKRGFGGWVSETGDTLYISGWEGTDNRNTLYTLDLTNENAEVVKLFDEMDAQYSILGERTYTDGRSWLQRLFGEKLQEPVTRYWIWTTKDAPKGKVISINKDHPQQENWTEVVPESEHVLRRASFVGERLVLSYLKDAHSNIKVFDLTGRFVRNVKLPGIGTAYGFGGESDDPETFFTFTGFTDPATIFRYNVDTGKASKWKQSDVDFSPDDFETKQVFYTSKDGTKIPMFIMHKKGIELNGEQPTLLYGYGGFNISLTPRFSLSRLIWMEMGGVYAIANLRGGGEYGEDWHNAGIKLKKQNVFDDFIAAAEYLIDAGYTRSEKLAIQGGSNGGLLVGAVMTQRPELFGAAIPAVGVLDMLRYHKFTIGWAWADDYGTSEESPEMYRYLKNYSPLHNLKPGTRYPTTMITTADHDDRVVPAHSYKFAAALQKAHEGENPVLIRIETKAGHGRGTPVSKRIDQYADQYAFLFRALQLEQPETTASEEQPEPTKEELRENIQSIIRETMKAPPAEDSTETQEEPKDGPSEAPPPAVQKKEPAATTEPSPPEPVLKAIKTEAEPAKEKPSATPSSEGSPDINTPDASEPVNGAQGQDPSSSESPSGEAPVNQKIEAEETEDKETETEAEETETKAEETETEAEETETKAEETETEVPSSESTSEVEETADDTNTGTQETGNQEN